jgi:hypothetical protein
MIADARVECGYDLTKGTRFFCAPVALPTEYRKVTSGGIMGARFVDLREVIGAYSSASDVAHKLAQATWE